MGGGAEETASENSEVTLGSTMVVAGQLSLDEAGGTR